MPSASAVVFFAEFKRKNIDGTLLNSFNKVADAIKWENDEDITAAAEKIGASNIIIKIYNEHLDCYSAKRLSLSNNTSYHICSRDQFFEVYGTLSDNAKKFFQFLFMSPKLLFEHYCKKYSEGILENCFDLYLNDKMNELDDDVLYGPYSIIDCIVNPVVSSAIMSDINSEITNPELFWSHLEMLINYGKTTGRTHIVDFNHALTITQKLSSTWNQLLTSSHTMNENAAATARNMHEADTDIDRVVNIYRGIYTDVPDDYPPANDIVTGLVSNFINFNKMSRQRKLQVSNYLLNNRDVFNKTLAQSIKIVSDSIARDCDKCDGVDFSKYGLKNIDTMGYKNSNGNYMEEVAKQVKDSFASVRGKQSVQKMNYIVNCFIPLMNKFKSEIMNEYGSDSSRIFSSLNNNFQMFGGDIFEDEEPAPVLEVPEPEIKYVRDASFDDMYAEAIYGGDPIINVSKGPELTAEQMVKEIIDAQIDFNKQYEQCYRELIKAIEGVRFDHVYADSLNKLYPLCRVFNDIAIKKTKTTIYLSGLYGKKNRNNAYKDVVHQTIQTLQDSKMNQFADCIRVLQKLEQLLINSANKAKDIRARFIKSPRVSSALLIVAETQVKIPCNLTNADFTAFDEAINRLYYQLRNTSSESNILNSKDEIKKYLDKVTDRAAIIKEKYDIDDQQLLYTVQKIPDVNLRNITLQVKRALNKTKLDAILYINNVVETHLTKQKMEDIHSKALTHEEIKKIEHAYLLFRRAKLTSKYKEEFKKLQKLLDENKSIFEVVNQVAKIFEASRYIEFIAMIYNELHIFGDSFNWQEFNKNMLQFMVLNSIDVVSTYRLPEATDENLQSTTPKMIIQTKEKFFMDLAALICRAGGKKDAYAKIYKILCNDIGAPYDITSNAKILNALGITSATAFPCPAYNNVVKEAFNTINEKDGKRDKNVFNNAMGIAFKTYNDKYDNNDTIIDAVFDSLVLGVVNVIDRYWQLKYRGTLPLPMNVNMMMKGGSVFDTDEFHDVSSANVIPEAVPFYITALNVCQYYIQELVKKNDAHGLIQELKISSISVLYPIYKIFNKYHATIETLTVAQLTTCVGVLNELWNQTTGSNEMKLSASIDLLLNELNASIFLSSDLENSIIESGFGSVASFNRTMYADLDKVANIINDIYKSAAMNSYIGHSPEEQQIGFERLMHKCYVRIKDVPEAQRMTELRSMLDAHDDTNIPMHDYYKFMDLVVAPLVICYTSYNNVFNLFNVFATQTAAASASIDLTKINIDIDGDVQNFWQYMNKPGLSYQDIDRYIKDCPAVQRWNLIQFGKIIENYIKTNKLTAPNFWFPTARNTWPTQPTCSYAIHDVQGYTAALPALRSVFSEINAKTIGDYFEYAVRQFASDVDQTLHVFMSYPGLNDRIIKNIEDNLHDRLDATKILETKQDFNTLWKVFQTIKVEKSAEYIYPKWPAINIPVLIETNDSVVPPLTNSNDGAKISIIGDKLKFPAKIELKDYVSFGASKFIKDVTLGKNYDMCRNTWTDYVIFRLAQCHPKYQIPYKLVQMLQADPIIGKFCQPMYLNKDKAASYAFEPVATKNGHNVYNNYMTQNIIARSSLESNKAITDYSTFGQVAINSMVAILPYLISRVQNIFETTKSETKIDDGTNLRVLDECGSLIGILSKFYNEISLSVTPMMFLQEGISGYGRDHCIGELRDYIDRSIDNITDFSGLEWANKYKFVNLTSITFPDFKNKDKFEWIHKFADNIFVHPIFRQNFGIIMENIGRQAWNSIIAKSLINELSSVKKVNDAFVKQLRSILNIFVGSGSSNMDELQYLFDKSFNENMVDKLLTSSAVNDFGFRIQGGYVSEEFKKFADWQTAKIEPGELKAIGKEVHGNNNPDTYINYEGWIVQYEANDETHTAKYYFAGYTSEGEANRNLGTAAPTHTAGIVATGTNGHPPSDDATNGYKGGKLLGHGMLTAINWASAAGAAPAGSPTGATADHYYYKYILYDDDKYKYDLVKESRPLMKKDINSLKIVRALENGVDLSSQLKPSNDTIPDAFDRTKVPTTNVTNLYDNLKDKNRDYNTITKMKADSIVINQTATDLVNVNDENVNQNLFNYINYCIDDIKTSFKTNSSNAYIDKFLQMFIRVVSANILNDGVSVGLAGYQVQGSNGVVGPAIKTAANNPLHVTYDGNNILHNPGGTVSKDTVKTAIIWNRLYNAMYSNLDHYITDKTLIFDINDPSMGTVSVDDKTNLSNAYTAYDATYNKNIGLINKFMSHPINKWDNKIAIFSGKLPPIIHYDPGDNHIKKNETFASFNSFYQTINPSTSAITDAGADIPANAILKPDNSDFTDNTKTVINAILSPIGKNNTHVDVVVVRGGADDDAKRNNLQAELQALALEWAIGELVTESLNAGNIYENIDPAIRTALINPIAHNGATAWAGNVIAVFNTKYPLGGQGLQTDTLEHFITDYMKLYDIYRKKTVGDLETAIKAAQTTINTEIGNLVTDTELATNISLCIKINGYIKIIKDRVKELEIIMYDKNLIDQMDANANYNAPINMPKDYSERTDFGTNSVGQHILNKAFGIVVYEFMKYMQSSTLSKLVNHTNKVVGPKGNAANVITSLDATNADKTTPNIDEFINLTYSDETGTLEIPGYKSDNITHQCYFLLLKNRYKLQNTRDPYFRKALKTFEAIIYCLCQKYNAKSSTAKGHIFYNYGNKGASIQGNDLYPAEIPLFDAFIDDITSITSIPTTFNNMKTQPKMISSWAMQASPVATKVYALKGTTSDDVGKYKKEIVDILSSQWTIKYKRDSGYENDYCIDTSGAKAADPKFAINKITEPTGLFYFSIMDIFKIIMDSNLNTFIDVNIDKVENYGFLLPPRITGGVEIENMLRDPEGKDALHRMMKLYDNQYVPYRIFTTLFSSGVAFRCNSTPDIVQAAMVYFHKFNIGMSSIFNNLCFAQLFLNRNILDNVVCRLGTIVTELPIKDDTENRTTYDMIKAYVAAMVKKDGDKCSIAWNNQGDYMKHDDTDERAKIFKQEKFIADVKRDSFNMINNTYKAPSLNNNFACAFLSYTDGAKVRSLLMLPFTKAFKHLHRLDVQCTYISMLISMLKLTSFYDADYETDISYFGDQNNDPFNAI